MLFLLFLVMTARVGFAQSRTVSGSIVDASDNTPLAGARVVATGSQTGTTSGTGGNFLLSVPASATTLQISLLGYEPQTVTITDNMTVRMEPESIDEILVIGYGTVKKSDLTGSVSSVKGDDLMKSKPMSLQQGMQGRVAGVNISSSDGAPGGGISVDIRGSSSLNGSSQPLYVIDGVPITTSDIQESSSLDRDEISSRNALSFLNPADIESVEILKDASSTAIYGSRGANGVIMITTKSGQSGQARVTVSNSLSISNVTKKIRMLTAREYAEQANLAYINTQLINGGTTLNPGQVPHSGRLDQNTGKYTKGPDDFDNTSHTYWQDQVFRTGVSNDVNLNISGGSKDMDYVISGNYVKHNGVMKNSDYTRYNIRTGINKELKKWLKIGTSTNFSHSLMSSLKNTTNSTGNGNEGVVRSALYFPAHYQLGDKTIEEDNYKLVTNPVDYANALNENKNYNFYTSNYAQFTLTKGLMFKTSLGYNTSINFSNRYYNRDLYEGRDPIDGKSSAGDNTWASTVFDNILMFNRSFGKHNVNATLGTSYEAASWYNKGFIVQGFGSDITNGWLLGDAAERVAASSRKGEQKLFSIIMRGAYNYDSRYYLTFTAREDYSSKFIKANRAAFFPSVGVSWRPTQEKFMRDGQIKEILTNLKLRYSYGLTGNQAIDSYATFANMVAANYPFGVGVVNGYATDATSPGNRDLKWETTYQHDAGIDLTLFGRIELIVDVYRKTTKDLLQKKQKPPSTGLSYMYSNFGTIENKGLEIALNANIIARDKMFWSAGGNISFNRNKIVYLGTDRQFPDQLWDSYRPFVLAQGRPTQQFIGYIEEGIWSSREEVIASPQFQHQYPGYTVGSNDDATELLINQKWIGEIKYKDLDGDDQITENDLDYIGSPMPKFTYGFNTSFSYKGFDINVLFQGVYGNKIFNQALMRWYNSGSTHTKPAWIANEVWSPTNLEGTAPKLYTTSGRTIRLSSRYLEDGSYLKLRTVSIGYTFVKPFNGVSDIRLSLTGNNLWTITNYKGYDPEVNSFGSNPTTRGIDGGAYPQSRSFILGASITF